MLNHCNKHIAVYVKTLQTNMKVDIKLNIEYEAPQISSKCLIIIIILGEANYADFTC